MNAISDSPLAHVIRSDEEAIEIARRLAGDFDTGAAERDRDRILPREQVEAFSRSGLWAITVPKSHGGADVSYATLAKVISIISWADPSIGQIPQSHFAIVDYLRDTASAAQQAFYFSRILAGSRLGNAAAEIGAGNGLQTRLTAHEDGYLLNGRKFFSTGALFAHYVPVAAMDETGRRVTAIAAIDAAGLTIIDDWSGFGQRTTASGSVVLDNVFVSSRDVVPTYLAFERPTLHGPVAQIVQAAIDAGIAARAIEDTIRYVQEHARPWRDSGLERASQDPYTIAQIGDLSLKRSVAETMLERAGLLIDRAMPAPDDDNVARASIAVAEAKILTTELALLASTKLIELGGARSTLSAQNLDRHWRNARTHTTHDPVRWKYNLLGEYHLNGVKPPRHGFV